MAVDLNHRDTFIFFLTNVLIRNEYVNASRLFLCQFTQVTF